MTSKPATQPSDKARGYVPVEDILRANPLTGADGKMTENPLFPALLTALCVFA